MDFRRALLVLAAVPLAACSPSSPAPDHLDAHVEEQDAGPADSGPPVMPHPCDVSGACLDWVVEIGATGDGDTTAVEETVPTTDGVWAIGNLMHATSQPLAVGASTVPLGADYHQAFAVRLDGAGALQASALVDLTPHGEGLTTAALLPSGDLLVGGFANVDDRPVGGTSTDHQILAARVTASGTVAWTATYGGPRTTGGSPGELAKAIAVSPDGRVFVAAELNNDFPSATGDSVGIVGAAVIEIDPATGSALWARVFGGVAFVDSTRLLATDAALYVALTARDGTGTSMLDLASAGSFPIGSTQSALLVSLSRDTGEPIDAWAVPSSQQADIQSIVPGSAGLLVAGMTWDYGTGSVRNYSTAHVWQISDDLATATELVSLDGGSMVDASAAYSAAGEIMLAGDASLWIESTDHEIAGYSDGSDMYIRGYDAEGGVRWEKFDGDGHGYERAHMTTADTRVFLYGTYSDAFRFESLTLATAGTSLPSFVVQMTVSE